MQFSAYSYITVTEPDPEDGERRERIVWQVMSQDKTGARQLHDHGFTTEQEATRMAERITAAVEAGRKLDEQHWYDTYPMYGSEAYQAGPDGFDSWADEERYAEQDGGMVHHSHGGWRWAA